DAGVGERGGVDLGEQDVLGEVGRADDDLADVTIRSGVVGRAVVVGGAVVRAGALGRALALGTLGVQGVAPAAAGAEGDEDRDGQGQDRGALHQGSSPVVDVR